MNGENETEKKRTSGAKVVVNSIIYSASGVLLRCFNLFLLPLYTIYLTTEDYGVNSIATSFVSTMGFIVAFSLFSAVLRFYVEYKDDAETLKRFYGTVCTFVFLSGVSFFVLLTILREPLSKYVFAGIDYYPVIFVCLISLIFYCEQQVFDSILKSQQKAMRSSLLNIISFLLTVGLNILFVVFLRLGAIGTILASGISYTAYSLYFIIYLLVHGDIILCLDLKLLKSALKYSIPIMPHNLSTQIAQLISKVLIGDVVSLASLGVYTVAAQFGNISDTIQIYVDNAYGPWLYEKLHDQEAHFKESIRLTVRMLISVISIFFLGISLFSQDYILLFVAKEYHEAWKYVPLIVFTFSIKTTYYFYVEILFYYKQASRYLFLATLSSSLINIVFSYFLIPAYGVAGSIAADAISMMIRVIIVIAISKKYDDVGLRVGDFAINILILFLFSILGLLLSFTVCREKFSIVNFIFKITVVIVYATLVYVRNKNEIRPLFQKMVRQRRNNN